MKNPFLMTVKKGRIIFLAKVPKWFFEKRLSKKRPASFFIHFFYVNSMIFSKLMAY